MKMLWKLTDNIKYEDCEVRDLSLLCFVFSQLFWRYEPLCDLCHFLTAVNLLIEQRDGNTGGVFVTYF